MCLLYAFLVLLSAPKSQWLKDFFKFKKLADLVVVCGLQRRTLKVISHSLEVFQFHCITLLHLFVFTTAKNLIALSFLVCIYAN